MEKLIELLNEYDNREKYGIKRKIGTDPIGIYGYLNGYGLGFTSKSRIISKEYGFIKWLVEKDKIDLFSRNALFISEDTENGEEQRPYSFYEEMLIRLAISDTPIEDLISYLK